MAATNWTEPPSVKVRRLVSESFMDTYVRDNEKFFSEPPRCSVYDTTLSNISATTLTPVNFNSENWDSDTMHDVVTNTHRMICPRVGMYLFNFKAQWVSGAASGYRYVGLYDSAGTMIAIDTIQYVTGVETEHNLSYQHYVATANSWFQIKAYSAALSSFVGTAYYPTFAAEWIAP